MPTIKAGQAAARVFRLEEFLEATHAGMCIKMQQLLKTNFPPVPVSKQAGP